MKSSRLSQIAAAIVTTFLLSSCRQVNQLIRPAEERFPIGQYTLVLHDTSTGIVHSLAIEEDGKKIYAEDIPSEDNVSPVLVQNFHDDLVPNAPTLLRKKNEHKTAVVNLSLHDPPFLILEHATFDGKFRYEFFQLGDTVKHVATLPNGQSRIRLEEIHEGSAYQIIAAPNVILRLKDGKLSPDKSAKQKIDTTVNDSRQ